MIRLVFDNYQQCPLPLSSSPQLVRAANMRQEGHKGLATFISGLPSYSHKLVEFPLAFFLNNPFSSLLLCRSLLCKKRDN